jgi:hypothetical protein
MASGRNGSAKKHRSTIVALKKVEEDNDEVPKTKTEVKSSYSFRERYRLNEAAWFIISKTHRIKNLALLEKKAAELELRLRGLDKSKKELARSTFERLSNTEKDYIKVEKYPEFKEKFHLAQLALEKNTQKRERTLEELAGLWKSIQETDLRGTGFETGILRMILQADFQTIERKIIVRIKKNNKRNDEVKEEEKIDRNLAESKKKFLNGPSSGYTHFTTQLNR